MESRNTCVNQFYSHKNTNLCSEHLCLQQPYEEIHSQKYRNGITKYSCKKQNGVEELRNTVAKKYGYNGVEKYLREPVPPTQHIKPSSEHLCWPLGQKSPDIPDANELDTNSSQNHHHR